MGCCGVGANPGSPPLRVKNLGGVGLGVGPWCFLVGRGVFGVRGKLLVSLEMPPAFFSILYGFFFFFALLKGNSSVSMLADLETAGSGLTAQPAVLALAN